MTQVTKLPFTRTLKFNICLLWVYLTQQPSNLLYFFLVLFVLYKLPSLSFSLFLFFSYPLLLLSPYSCSSSTCGHRLVAFMYYSHRVLSCTRVSLSFLKPHPSAHMHIIQQQQQQQQLQQQQYNSKNE